jgi:hypothetical protein
MFNIKGQRVYYKGREVDPFEIFDQLNDLEREELIEILENIILG